MISTEQIDSAELISLGFKDKLQRAYDECGIPRKYQFMSLGSAWSTEFSSTQKLTGLAKKRSEAVEKFVSAYINGIDAILNGGGLKVTFKNSIKVISDLFLDGKKASGKTLLASLIAQEAIMRGYKVKFVDWVDYLDRFQSFESRTTNEEYFLNCIEVDLLIIDSVFDYGINNSKFFVVQLDRLISNRQNSGKITICTVDSSAGIPAFGFIWNRFSRETYKLTLPEPGIKK